MAVCSSTSGWTSQDVEIKRYPRGTSGAPLRPDASYWRPSSPHAPIKLVSGDATEPFHLVTDTRVREVFESYHRYGKSDGDRTCPFSPEGLRTRFVAVLGHHSPITCYQSESKVLRQIIQDYFCPDRLDKLEVRWENECRHHVGEWGKQREIWLCREAIRLATFLTVRNVLGIRENCARISEGLSDFFSPFPTAISTQPDSSLPSRCLSGRVKRCLDRVHSFLRNLPSLIRKIVMALFIVPFRLRPMIRRVIGAQLKAPDPEGLSFARFLQSRGCTPEQMEDCFLTILMAGHETLGYLLAFTLDEYSRNAKLQARARNAADPRAFQQRVICEALRKYPTGMAVRRARHDLQVSWPGGSHRIYQGEQIVLSPLEAGRDASLWKDPESFDVDRLGIDRLPTRPFGSGRHSCVGKEAAFRQAAVALRVILERVELTPLESCPELLVEGCLKPVRDFKMCINPQLSPQPASFRRL